jgi:EAL domain-containing protein (putative c-di-GMP-specific phosphodiesterase class I)
MNQRMNSLSSNFDPTRAEARQTLVAHRLAQAIAEGALKVHYQPEIDIHSHQVLTLEALCRWHDLELNQVAPDEFIAVAEAKGLIALLGAEVLRQVLQDLPLIVQRWPQVRVAVNVSGIELGQPNCAKVFLENIQKHQPTLVNHLELELTESIFLYDLATVRQNLEALRQAGLSIAIDDFGTGQSSLGRLHTLPFDKIKMDRSFVVALHEPMVQALVKAMVNFTAQFDRSLVVEGLETIDQVKILKRLGCKLAQGYLISQPKVLAELASDFVLASS